MQRWSAVAALALTVIVGVSGSMAAATAAPSNVPYVVYGYYPVDYPGDTAAFESLSKVDRVDTVGAFLFQFDEQGNVTGQSDPKLMELARSRGLKVEAVIHNYRGGFDRGIATSILTNPAVQARAIDQIENLLAREGYHGVQIDLENVDPQHRAQLSQFVQRLSERLKPQGRTVSIAVPAKTWDDPNNGWSGAFDYRALGQAVDEITLMTYDEHWITSEAGPIASLPWVQRVVEYAARTVPEEKLLLGIAGYGYDWPKSGGMATMIKARDAAQLAQSKGATILWDSVAQAPYFQYTENGQPRVVYFENAESTRQKLNLVTQNQLGGVALWRLGFEDPAIWNVVAELLGEGRTPPATQPPGTEPPGQEPPGTEPPGNEPPGTEPPGQQPPGTQPPASGGYVVQWGDTLWLIARRHGITLEALMAANPGVNPWWLMPGQRLTIPRAGIPMPPGGSTPTRTYVVQPGDTFYLIGQRLGISWESIVAANPGVNAWSLMPGQRIVLPGF